MAESNLIQELQLEVICSICSQYMKEPVRLSCGHNYCQACINQHWDRVEEEEELKQCPLCLQSFRKRNFSQNKLLANVVGIVQRFPPPAAGLGQPQPQDQDQDVRSRSSMLCGVESLGQDPLGQQESFRQRLEILKKDLEIVLSLPCDGEMREHLHHFLHDGQQMILQKLQELEEGQERKKEPGPEQQHLYHFLCDGQQMILQKLQELEEGQERKKEPGPEQQIDLTAANLPPSVKTYPKSPLSALHHLFHFLRDGQQRILQKLQELVEGQERKKEPGPEQQDENITWSRREALEKPCDCRLPLLHRDQRIQMKSYTVEVTLDPKTANRELILSSDWKSVRLGDEWKDMLNCRETFDMEPCILASKGFSSGRYYWEVEVGDNGCWAVGVAKGSVRRKGRLTFTPEHGFWTVEMHMGKYWAGKTLVYYYKRLFRVGIYVDYVEGLVAFHNAETMDHLYTFTASFKEEIFPFFYTQDKKTPLSLMGPTEQTQPSPSSSI